MSPDVVRIPFEAVAATFRAQLGKPYRLKAEWPLNKVDPPDWDCSEMVEWCLGQHGIYVPDGSFNQYAFMEPVAHPWPGTFFFGASDDLATINHVNFVLDAYYVIEARADKGKVVLRPVSAWMAYPKRKGPRRIPGVSFVWPDGSPTIQGA